MHGTEPRWIGAKLRRVEDRSLLTGAGTFTDDVRPRGSLDAYFVRADLAGAPLLGIDTSAALEVPGVHAVLTDADLGAPGIVAILDRPEFVATEMPLLARDTIRYAGEPVALVLADSAYAAEDGADRVAVDLGGARPVLTIEDALDGLGPVHAEAPGNVLLDVQLHDDDTLDEVLDDATVVISETFTSARVTAAPMESRATVASWEPREQRLVVWTSTQVPHLVRTCIARALEVPESTIRVIAPDVGGGFGQKCAVAREEVAVAVAAYRSRGTVRWAEDRRENLVGAFQGHEQRYTVRAGFDADGRLVGVDLDVVCDVGAYSCFPFSCGVEPLMAAGEFPNAYKVPRYRVRTRGVATTKAPMAPYRGVSRPQICFVMERLLDLAARELGIDRADVRRRNVIRRDEFPYTGVTGITYDAATYLEALELGLEAVDYEAFAARRAAGRAEGRLLGLGFSCFSERTGYGTATFAARGMVVTPGYESARMTMDPSGKVEVAVGASAHGQGHRTTLAQVVADQLGIHPYDVRVVQGDTDVTPYGWGTFASRGAAVSGGACQLAGGKLADKLRRVAAHLFEADPDDIELRAGGAEVRGAPERRYPLAELARIAHHERHRLPEEEEARLEVHAEFDPPGTFSNAAHVVVVEIDPGTGGVDILDYVVVEDCGVVINPTIVDGQVRGGVAQGIACALYEELRYEPDGGQCTTSTFMDYLVPTAGEIPPIRILHLETPSEHSETGAKGMGEGGTIGAPAAIANAVADALSHVAARVNRLPITPADVVSALTRQEHP
ncbi:xanthine dehydrogenase family protein molybdopterin-binding subunit [Nitriliruptor alkaliphilus]|uniref:xanthine dehydrogenase family protein molybdopterin-binding subunit n=1 Tax=Nitriliruptor alkaliphilus TaxID=427918 RepID=UPI000696CF1C|nr:xanthine dehydrogenase family protein molybdopterin-binding subunit [Nitriliruptor alkaliphilus]